MKNINKPLLFISLGIVFVVVSALVVTLMLTAEPVSAPMQPQTSLEAVEPIKKGPFALHVRGAVDYNELKTHGLATIVDYGSESCIPCRQMAPLLAKLNRELEGKAFIKFVDVRKYREGAIGIPIRLIPSQILIDASGNPFTPSEALARKISFIRVQAKDPTLQSYTVHEGSLTEQQMREILAEMGVRTTP